LAWNTKATAELRVGRIDPHDVTRTVGIVVCLAVTRLDDRAVVLVAQPEIQRQVRPDLPVGLREEGVVRAAVQGLENVVRRQQDFPDRRTWQTQQIIGEAVAAVYATERIAAADLRVEPLVFVFAHDIHTEPQNVSSMNPVQRVAYLKVPGLKKLWRP